MKVWMSREMNGLTSIWWSKPEWLKGMRTWYSNKREIIRGLDEDEVRKLLGPVLLEPGTMREIDWSPPIQAALVEKASTAAEIQKGSMGVES